MAKQNIITDAKMRVDGWLNLLSSLGGKKDRTSNTTHSTGALLSQVDLEILYRDNGFAKKIIDLPAYEMTRQWIDIENDPDNFGLQKLSKLKAKTAFRDFIKWGNLFGGSIIVMGIDDGGDLESPLNEEGIRTVEFLRVYDRFQVSWTTTDINDNPESRYYGEPEFYTVQNYTTSTPFKVHTSRVIRYDGSDIPERSRTRNQGWGDSVLQAIYDELREYGVVKSSVVSIVQDFIQTLLQIEGLTDLISSGKEEIVKKRLELIDLSRSVNNTILLDKDEQFSKSASTVTGLDQLMNQFSLALSGVTGIPLTKLFGQAPAGLNATGESDIRNFYDEIKSKQEDILLPGIERLHYIIMLAKKGDYKGKINEDAKINFNPLWQLTDQQDSEWKYKIAQTDEVYIRNGVLSPEEVAVSRFENGFSPDTTVDFNNREIKPDEDEPTEQ